MRDLEARLGLLVREGIFAERNGWYEFVDPAMQEAIYDHVLDERDLVHRRALRYWLATRERNTIGRLARIAFHAAASGDRATAAACWATLARRASRAGDRDYTDELLERVTTCLGGSVPPEVAAVLSNLDA